MERRVGDQRRRAWRAVHQRHPLALFEVASHHPAHHVHQRQDLARTDLAIERHRGQRPVKHRHDPVGDYRADLGSAVDEIGEPGEHDPADHPLVEAAAAEAPAGAEHLRPAGPSQLVLWGNCDLHFKTRPARHPVHERGPVRGQQLDEGRPALGHHRAGNVTDHDPLAIRGDPAIVPQREVLAAVENDRHPVPPPASSTAELGRMSNRIPVRTYRIPIR